MDLKDLLKQYEKLESQKTSKPPMELLIQLREQVDDVVQQTLQWYLTQANSFEARRLAYEVRLIRDVLLEFQLVLEGIGLVEGKDA